VTDKDDKKEPSEHVGIILGECETHEGQHVLFERDGAVALGTLRPFEEGKPLDPNVELVEIQQAGPFTLLRNHGRVGRATSQGPAMVNSKAFKTGWDQIFGAKNTAQKMVN